MIDRLLPFSMAMVALIAIMLLALLAVVGFARRNVVGRFPMIVALIVTATWLAVATVTNAQAPYAVFLEGARNLAWLWYMAALTGYTQSPGDEGRMSAVGWIYVGLFVLQSLSSIVALLPVVLQTGYALDLAHFASIQMLISAGALVLLHNVFEAGRRIQRLDLGFPLSALSLLWIYDLNLYAITYLGGRPAFLMEMLRPLQILIMAVLLTAAVFRPGVRQVRFSRPMAFRSLAVAAVLGWLGLLAALATVLPYSGKDFSGFAQIGVLMGSAVIVALLAASPTARARLRVLMAKHLFEHRYDYRAEWLRFTATLNKVEPDAALMDARVTKAIADIVESPGGWLLTRSGDGYGLTGNSLGRMPPLIDDRQSAAMAHWMLSSERIIQLDEVRRGAAPFEEVGIIPEVLLRDQTLWIIVPLIHNDRIEGIAILTRPPLDRALDWEDVDWLRIAGRQAASHIAEARGSEALAESARFDEFHRRFAFIMHDVKNLASQMALLARNAERHGDNPEFREDMIETLRVSADRLSQLMQRLSQQDRVRVDQLMPVDIAIIVRRVATAARRQHDVTIVGAQQAFARANAETVEQLLTHLLQNAIDASAADSPIMLRIDGDDGQMRLSVEDKGKGMTPLFMRNELFRPFSSTKEGGFGIGAYQARQLAEAMGGQLHVSSIEGRGTIFTLVLPQATPDHFEPNRSEAA